MSFLHVDGTRLHYRIEGKPGLPVLVLGNSLGTDLHMWHRQLEPLMQHFMLLRFDTRGHGASDAPPGDYTVERLGRDVLALADHVGLDRFAYCGLSLGALVGQWLAVNAPVRLDALVLANGAAYLPSHESWSARMELARSKGMAALIDMVMPRFFSQGYRDRDEPFYHAMRNTFLGTDPQGYAACCAAARDADFRGRLKEMRVRTLVIGGRLDAATPADSCAAELAAGIPGAQMATLEAGHISCVEQPGVFSRSLIQFLSPTNTATGATHMNTDDKLYQEGMKVRRHILGTAHVDRAVARTTNINREFQELIVRYGWGEIWTRPGLDYRERRMLVLGTMMALGRWEEFRMHLRAALEGGMSLEDMKEVFLQQAIYCGVPIANTAHHHLEEIVGELKGKGVTIVGLEA